ncbi:MAG: glycoside hydrolase family 38 C-terminal domain-containing protein, partial [Planctomycetota bacterium]
LPEQHDWAAKNQRQAGIFNETLAATGYGDGGGGANAEMCERVRRQADLAGVPRTKWGKISDFFDRLHDVRDQLPTWHGEMYVEFHRGVQTTHGHLKAAYRAAERGLQLHEAAAALTGKSGPTDDAWQRVVFAQFHDYLPGSSIQEVYDEGVPELQGIADEATSAAKRLVEGGDTDCLFNALPMERTQLVEGKCVKLPPLSVTAIAQAETIEAPAVELHGSADAPTLSNGRVQATFDAAGCVTRFVVDGHAIPLAGPANQLYILPDHPAAYPAWDIDRPAMSLGQPTTGPATQSSDGSDARRTLSFTRKLGHSSTATVRYILEVGSPVLKVEVDVDWHESNTVLKAAWPTKYNAREARYGSPFGSTMRAQIGDTATDESRFENPLSRWMCLSDESGGDGIMLLTE